MILQKEYSRSDFINQIISKPFCTDDFNRDGIYRANKRQALNKIYIEHNNDSFINSIVFDIDTETAAISWQDANIPIPNFITQNPSNGHAHLFYALNSPVCITDKANKKPQILLKGVTEGLTARLNADVCYTGKITKNPLNPHWRTFWNNTERYELNYLREFVDEGKRLTKKVLVRTSEKEGRNTTLFDNLRFFAYSVIFKYQKANDFCGFLSALEQEADVINNEFKPRLNHKEIQHTIKSISEWVWNKFDYETFSDIQKARRAKRTTKQKQIETDLLSQALMINEE